MGTCRNIQTTFSHIKQNQRRRTGTAGRRPFATSQLGPYSDTGARQPVKSFSRYRPQSKVSKKRTRPISNRKAQNRQQPAGQQSKRPPIPLFLRPPRPARPGLNQQAKTVSSPPIIGGINFVNTIHCISRCLSFTLTVSN